MSASRFACARYTARYTEEIALAEGRCALALRGEHGLHLLGTPAADQGAAEQGS